MIGSPILIDTNIFMLLVAGLTNRNIINAHKNISNQFTAEDFDVLASTMGHGPELILLPNVLTESSHLLAQIAQPYRGQLRATMRAIALHHAEIYVRSGTAVAHVDFLRPGLTDCALLSTDNARFHLLTVDLDLYLTFLRARRPVTNFRHVIDGRSERNL